MSEHPEKVDPPWFQQLIQRAFEREYRRLRAGGAASDDAAEAAMWHVFALRDNLPELYRQGGGST